jgi:hypothetical protein
VQTKLRGADISGPAYSPRCFQAAQENPGDQNGPKSERVCLDKQCLLRSNKVCRGDIEKIRTPPSNFRYKAKKEGKLSPLFARKTHPSGSAFPQRKKRRAEPNIDY